jgi:hypothetical protein
VVLEGETHATAGVHRGDCGHGGPAAIGRMLRPAIGTSSIATSVNRTVAEATTSDGIV